MRDDAGLQTGIAGEAGESLGVAAAVFAEGEVAADHDFRETGKFKLEKSQEVAGTDGGEFAGEGDGVDLSDAAGGDAGLVLGGGGEEERSLVRGEQVGDMRIKRQAGGAAVAVAGGIDRGAEDGLVAQVNAVELAQGQHDGRGIRMVGFGGHATGAP